MLSPVPTASIVPSGLKASPQTSAAFNWIWRTSAPVATCQILIVYTVARGTGSPPAPPVTGLARVRPSPLFLPSLLSPPPPPPMGHELSLRRSPLPLDRRPRPGRENRNPPPGVRCLRGPGRRAQGRRRVAPAHRRPRARLPHAGRDGARDRGAPVCPHRHVSALRRRAPRPRPEGVRRGGRASRGARPEGAPRGSRTSREAPQEGYNETPRRQASRVGGADGHRSRRAAGRCTSRGRLRGAAGVEGRRCEGRTAKDRAEARRWADRGTQAGSGAAKARARTRSAHRPGGAGARGAKTPAQAPRAHAPTDARLAEAGPGEPHQARGAGARRSRHRRQVGQRDGQRRRQMGETREVLRGRRPARRGKNADRLCRREGYPRRERRVLARELAALALEGRPLRRNPRRIEVRAHARHDGNRAAGEDRPRHSRRARRPRRRRRRLRDVGGPGAGRERRVRTPKGRAHREEVGLPAAGRRPRVAHVEARRPECQRHARQAARRQARRPPRRRPRARLDALRERVLRRVAAVVRWRRLRHPHREAHDRRPLPLLRQGRDERPLCDPQPHEGRELLRRFRTRRRQVDHPVISGGRAVTCEAGDKYGWFGWNIGKPGDKVEILVDQFEIVEIEK